MQFDRDEIEKMRRFWSDFCGKELTDAEALECETDLVGVFQVLLDVDARLKKQAVERQSNEHGLTERDHDAPAPGGTARKTRACSCPLSRH